MKNYFGIAAAIIAVVSLTGCTSTAENTAECYFSAKYRMRSLPVFDYYTMAVKGKTGSRIDVYLLVPYERIRFQKNGEQYTGSYNITFVLRDTDGNVAITRDESRPLVAATYESAVSAQYDAFMESFDLAPGKYHLEMNLVDEGSGLRSSVRKCVIVPVYEQSSLAASDFLLLERAVADARGVVLRPRFPSQLRSNGDSLGLFQEIYNLLPGDSIRLSFSYSIDRSYSESGRMVYRPFVRPEVEKEKDPFFYQKDSLFIARSAGTVRILQFFDPPRHGYTTFRRRISLQRAGVKQDVEQKRSWLVADPILAGRTFLATSTVVLGYIVTDDERDSLALAATEAEKQLRISKFWEEHGGPQRRGEFEERVREANELFTRYAEGWRTPMGAAYIVCGAPDYVECQGNMTEVWYYSMGNQAAAMSFRVDYYQDDEEPFYRILPFSTNDLFWRSCVDRWRRR